MLLTKAQLAKASVKDLQLAAANIKNEVAKREDVSKTELLKQVRKMAKDAGVSIEELLGKSPKSAAEPKAPRAKKVAGKVKAKVAPKYRNPADASQVWTGRGRQPLWVAAALAGGATMETLSIK